MHLRHPLTSSLIVLLLSMPQPVAAQEPSLASVLDRAAQYVADFHRRLSSIVAEERYVQEWTSIAKGRMQETTRLGHRELRSDLLLLKPAGDAPWTEYRDVFEVDGRPIRDRDARLVRMVLEPGGTTTAQLSSILRESARFNIGDIDRNVNTPVFSLQFLEPANQWRFAFKRTSEREPKTLPGAASSPDGVFRVSTEVWTIAYRERGPGTLIRTAQQRDQPVHGRFWIEPATGRVLMSELIVEDRTVRATIDVSFQSEPLLGILVPIEMREAYEGKRSNSTITGRATYGRFRQVRDSDMPMTGRAKE